MATRTLTSERDRKMTILLTPFMSCTAKLPIYSFFVSVFFPKRGGLIMAGLYLLGILVGILAAFLYNSTLFKGEPVPFVRLEKEYQLKQEKKPKRPCTSQNCVMYLLNLFRLPVGQFGIHAFFAVIPFEGDQ